MSAARQLAESERYIHAIVAAAPRLTPEQIRQLRNLLPQRPERVGVETTRRAA